MKKQMPIRCAAQQKGAVTLLVALTLPVLMGAAALAVDLAYLHVVRNELQNDADAAALAGARTLYKNATTSLDWEGATQQAQLAIGLNRAERQRLTDGQVQAGYWDTSQAVPGLQLLPMLPTGKDAPAVQVSVSKSEGQNLGPVRTFLAGIWGIFSRPVRATAVAGVTSPGSVSPGGVFPFAMSECMYQKYWNSTTSPAGPRIDPLTGKVHVFKVGSLYHYEGCDSGEWSPLDFKVSGADAIDDMIQTGNLVTLAVGDDIWVQSGVKNSLFQDVQKCSAAGNKSCEYVLVPVLSQVVSGSFSSIRGFACLHILRAVGGSQKYIEIEMSTQCKSPYSGGVGPNYGVVSPPSLFQ
ncbi:TadG family pilus assembly protein [Limnohabitans sp. 2KL-1]|uniref:TadG family pilus assembly protein n=1 Tax=Limnohabitans sp. 2KL-1 TaxID=1100699 RepID=UPI001304E29A|nr:TadG family pilus assembly protein [Limnohabitans sp. 2KL-1]